MIDLPQALLTPGGVVEPKGSIGKKGAFQPLEADASLSESVIMGLFRVHFSPHHAKFLSRLEEVGIGTRAFINSQILQFLPFAGNRDDGC
ncbi:hypothetical protein [Marinithermofilum abyssi]|uniref:hypothetical protein n=1 Tax=Marinithermofilum abyssi TaxID=1571185 RepID=UPI001E5A292E|nr:hypothetical protein [Marinithermofilum abyssi]